MLKYAHSKDCNKRTDNDISRKREHDAGLIRSCCVKFSSAYSLLVSKIGTIKLEFYRSPNNDLWHHWVGEHIILPTAWQVITISHKISQDIISI